MYKLIDAHCDTMSRLLDEDETLDKNTGMINLRDMKNFKSYVGVFAAYVSKEYKNPTLRAVEILDKAKEEIKKRHINLILSSAELENVINTNSIGAVLSIEDARALSGEISNLQFFYDYGVRVMTLAWNDDNDVIDGALTKNNRGLAPFGKEVVREMNKLGMIIDVSHASKKGFYDVLYETKTPVVASHSNCYSLCPHPRNLDDEQIKTLIKNDGLLCINFYPPFLKNPPDDADIESIIKHIDHALSLGAEDFLGLGSDFDGIDTTPKDVKSVKDYEKIIAKMRDFGYNNDLIDKITYKNTLNFIKKVEKYK